MPLRDASGAACLIPPPPAAFRSCARCWCKLNLSADGVLCQLRFFGAHVRRCVAASLACVYSGRGTPAMVCVNSVNRITATECDV